MKKVYLVFAIYYNSEENEAYTRVVHVCNDKDLAVEYANQYVMDGIRDFFRTEKVKNAIFCDVKQGEYISEKELFDEDGCIYLSTYMDDDITKGIKEQFSVLIETHEVKED